jgi:hypothetical protein
MTHARPRNLDTADPDPVERDPPQIRPADSCGHRDSSTDPRFVLDPVDCLHPSFADRRPDGFKVDNRLPSPSTAVSVPRPAAGRQFGLRQPPDPHKEGTKDERHSPRR